MPAGLTSSAAATPCSTSPRSAGRRTGRSRRAGWADRTVPTPASRI